HSRNALNGMAIGNTDFTITMANGKRRDGLTTGFTDTSNGEMHAGMARVLGVGFAVFLAWRKMPLIVVIIAAAVVTALLRLAGIN
ncbi:hypothetical protein ONK27_27850, partial [Salmonella enterica subsp. enterica serovar Virginia]|nr:hypothetical protein [Salmonella enterica subsp. enterica serovar Virginia]